MDAWRDAVVLVTGGTSGIGLAVAQACQARGARVIICARTAPTVQACRLENGFAGGHACDVNDVAQVRLLMADLTRRYGRLDVLVANTGALRESDFAQGIVDPGLIASTIDANLTGPIQLINQALPLVLASRSPRIVMVGSGFGWSPSQRAPLYSAAKAGVRAFVKALRMQLTKLGVQVLEAVPPVVDTPATAHHAVRKITPQAMAEAILRALDRGQREAFAGPTRLLPLMLRLAPGALERLTAKS